MLSRPVPLVSAEQIVSPASDKNGRKKAKDLRLAANRMVALVENSLSADTPSLTSQFVAGTNLWAMDLHLFAAQDAQLSLLVMDAEGRRLGYSPTNGISYNELLGLVTDIGQSPMTLRLFQPPAGMVYTATVTLLNPGPQPVPVSLFEGDQEVSDAVMVSMPSRVILDGDRGTVQSVDVILAEASQQQPLTNITATLSNLVQWEGTAVLSLRTNETQTLPELGAGESGGFSWPVEVSSAAERGKYVGTVRLSSGQTADLDVPVVAVVRRTTNVVSLFGSTNELSGELQTTVTNGGGGFGLTWVQVPKGYYVVHGQFGVAGSSTSLPNPTIDVGADGSIEWAFSGVFDLGVVVDNLETAFNNYLVAHSSTSNTIAVPIRLTGNTGESMQFGGLQLFLETVANKLRAVEVLPDKKARFELLAQPGFRYTIEASSNLFNWQLLDSVVATNSVVSFTDTTAPGARARFYRAVLE